MRKKDLPSAYTNYLENLVQAGILKMDKKASAPVSLPQKLDEKILDFCERLRKASFHKQAQEIEENFVSYKGLSSKLEAMIRDNMVGEHYEASTQLLGLPESATIYSPIEKQIETARKMLGEPLSKQADFIKTAAGFGEDVAEFAISPLAKLFQKLNAELNTSDVQSNIDTINENTVELISKIPNLNNELTGKLNKIQQVSETVKSANGKALSSQEPSAESLKQVQLAVSMLNVAINNVYSLYTSVVNVDKRLAEMDKSIYETKAIKDNCSFVINKLKKNVASVSKVYWSISNILKPKEAKPASTNGGIPNFLKRKAAFASKFQDMTNWLKSIAMASNPKLVNWANSYAPQYLESLKAKSQNFTDEEQYAGQFADFEQKLNEAYRSFQKYAQMSVAKPAMKPQPTTSPSGKPVGETNIVNSSYKNNFNKIANPAAAAAIGGAVVATNILGATAFYDLIKGYWQDDDIKYLSNNLKNIISAINKIDNSDLNTFIPKLTNIPNIVKNVIDNLTNTTKTEEGLNVFANSINNLSVASKILQACWAQIDQINESNSVLGKGDAKVLGEYRELGNGLLFGSDISYAMSNLANANGKIVKLSNGVANIYNRLKEKYLADKKEKDTKVKTEEKEKETQVAKQDDLANKKELYNAAIDGLIVASKKMEANITKIHNSQNEELLDWFSEKMSPMIAKTNVLINQAEKNTDAEILNKAIEESNKINTYLTNAIKSVSLKG